MRGGGAPLAGVRVELMDVEDFVDGTKAWFDRDRGVGAVTTDQTGHYEFDGVGAGTYRLLVEPSETSREWVAQWFDAVSPTIYHDEDEYRTLVTRAAPIRYEGYPINLDVDLVRGGSIAGDALGDFGEHGYIVVYDLRHFVWTSAEYPASYRFDRLAPGTYKVHCVPEPGDQFGDPEWYRDQPSFETATPVEVRAGEVTTGVDCTVGDKEPPAGDEAGS